MREGIALYVVSPAADPATRYSGYPVKAGLDGPLFSARCTHLLSVLGCASPAVVNQALAKSAPGLGPSGFHPHAFARTGLRAPLALRQGEPYPEFVTYDTGESLLARARPGDATAAIRICARLKKSPCSCPPPGQEAARPVDNCTARSGLCWASLAGRFCVRWLLHRNAFGDQGGAPLGSAG